MKFSPVLNRLINLSVALLTLSAFGVQSQAAEPIQVPITYAPESRFYLPTLIDQFNALACPQDGSAPLDPVTDEAIPSPICIIDLTINPQTQLPEGASSGDVAAQLVSALAQAPADTSRLPVIFQPGVSHWLKLVNFQSGQRVFELDATLPTTQVPVVVAIWDTYYQALLSRSDDAALGWADLVGVLNAPDGWQSYGLDEPQVRYGHTDPLISSTALSTLMSEFSASAASLDQPFSPLMLETVQDPAVQESVRNIEALIHHYFPRTTEFSNYIAQGSSYLQFVALEENDVIRINQERQQANANAERLVALYPEEGVFVHDHPMGIVNAPWTSQTQRDAAARFAAFATTPAAQETIMSFGLRPASSEVALDESLFSNANGIDAGELDVLTAPDADVIAEVQQSWRLVAKPADVLILIDTSGSMAQADKMPLVKEAIREFMNFLNPNVRLGLMVFDNEPELYVDLADFSLASPEILRRIDGVGERPDEITPYGQTALYEAVIAAIETLQRDPTPNRTRAIVLLSDGQNFDEFPDRQPPYTLADVTNALIASSDSPTPVLILPIAYGQESSLADLQQMASATATLAFDATNAPDIAAILRIIGGYF